VRSGRTSAEARNAPDWFRVRVRVITPAPARRSAAAAQVEGVYRPRFRLDTAVIRVPIVPGCDPRAAYGDLAGRGVRGARPPLPPPPPRFP